MVGDSAPHLPLVIVDQAYGLVPLCWRADHPDCFLQALSGVDLAIKTNLLENAALQSALETQFLLQIGVFTAVPMIINFVLEQGVLQVR